MDYQFSLAHMTVLSCPPPEVVYIAGLCGYEYASLRPVYLGLPGEPNYELAVNKEMMRRTKQAMADTGVKIHDVELFRITDDKDVGEYEAALEVGAELGAKSAITSIWTDDRPRYLEQFAKLCELAAQYGLCVDLEFVTWASVYNLRQVKEILEITKAPNAGVLIDTLHMYRSRVEPEELCEIPPEWFHFVHICDSPKEIPDRSDTQALIHTGRDARYYVGEGAVDFKAVMEKIPANICSVELAHIERTAMYGNAEHARRCLATAKEHFAEIGLKCPV